MNHDNNTQRIPREYPFEIAVQAAQAALVLLEQVFDPEIADGRGLDLCAEYVEDIMAFSRYPYLARLN